MQKKLVLRRNLRRGGGSGQRYLKYLAISAVSLIFLVIVTPYLLKQKSNESNKRPVPAKGEVTKELPKQPEQAASERVSEPAEPLETPAPVRTGPLETATAPESMNQSDYQAAPQPAESAPAADQTQPAEKARPFDGKVSPFDKPSPAAGFHRDEATKPAEPTPKDLFPKQKATAGEPLAPAQKEPAGKAKAAGPPASKQKGDYAIQVGSVFSDKSQARKVLKDISAKGHKAVVRSHGKGYVVTTGAVPKSMAYTLLEQMKIQGLNDARVIKVAPDK
jgi:hypothetical protein